MKLSRISFYWALFLLVFVFIRYPSGVQAAASADCAVERCAECDACGYCFGKDVPGNWEQCKACIYPDADDSALANTTLEIDPTLNRSVLQPAKGKYFTQLGCVDTSVSSFQDAGAAGGVLNFILTRVIFPITGVLAFMSIIYGAFLLAMSQDDQMQIQQGRRYIYGGIIGALFTFSVVLIVNTIGSDILRIPGFSRGTPVTIEYYASCYAQDDCPALNVYAMKTNTVPNPATIPNNDPFGHDLSPNLDKDDIIGSTSTGDLVGVVQSGNAFGTSVADINNGAPNAPQTQTITVSLPSAPDGINSFLLLEYAEDHFSALTDENIYIKSVTVNDVVCKDFTWKRVDGNGNYSGYHGNNEPHVKMNSVGYILCNL